MIKTLGQIAYDAASASDKNWSAEPWERIPAWAKPGWEAAASAIVEECAKVAEAFEKDRRKEGVRERDRNNRNVANRLLDQADGAMQAARDIRSLCQAKVTAAGDAVSPSALQSGDGGEAE